MLTTFNVCVTGAAGHIAYSTYNLLASSDVFSCNASINLKLIESDEKMDQLQILKLELEDCCYSRVQSIQIYAQSQKEEALAEADIVLFLGSAPRKPGMDRKQFFEQNGYIFRDYGKALDAFAKKTCKSLVVANPPNTNCLILSSNAPSIPVENFTCLTRLDHNRLVNEISKIFVCKPHEVKNAIVWGNHSKNQFCDLNYVEIAGFTEKQIKEKLLNNDTTEIQKKLHERGGFIADKTGSGTYLSASISIIDHMRDWFIGTSRMSSMGVIMQKQLYNIPAGICFSMPVLCYGEGSYKMVDDLELNIEQRKRIDESIEELMKEKSMVLQFIEEEK